MSRTLIETICDKLNICIGEEFFIKEHGATPYKFTKSKLIMYDNTFQDDWVNVKPEVLGKLITGEYSIIVPKFEPKLGTVYYGYTSNWDISKYTWGNFTYHDATAKLVGCLFRTFEEAKNRRADKFEELTGRKWIRD